MYAIRSYYEAAAALRDIGWDAEPSITTNQLRTSITERRQSAEMIRYLVGQQYDLYRVTEKTKTLEEIFLELIV